MNNSFLEITPSSKPFHSSNNALIFNIIGEVLRHALSKNHTKEYYNYNSFWNDNANVFYGFEFLNKPKNDIRDIRGDIVLTVDTSGYISNSSFKANLTKSEIDKINYYLLHVSNLLPFKNHDKVSTNINLRLSTILKTVNNDTSLVRYTIYDADSINVEELADVIEQPGIPAEFPGKADGWNKFLERNLNASIPAMNRAPLGKYTVTVSFYVDTEGNISDIEAENDPGYGTAEEVIRVMKKSPKWVPAIKNGKPMGYRQKQNIVFQVSGT